MDIIFIKRIELFPEYTLGVIYLNNIMMGVTLEPPKKENSQNISCINTSDYYGKVYFSTKFRMNCIDIIGEYKREDIVIHNGNYVYNTEGCILVGSKPSWESGNRCILESRVTLDYIIKTITTPDRLIISIRE